MADFFLTVILKSGILLFLFSIENTGFWKEPVVGCNSQKNSKDFLKEL